MILLSEYGLSLREKTAYFLAAGGLCALIGWLFYKSLAAAALMSLVSLLFYRKYRSYSVSRKKELINLQFKDVLYAFSDASASGKQADAAIFAAQKNLVEIYGEKNPLTEEFTHMVRQLREMNGSPLRILREFGTGCGIEDIRNFIDVYCICIESGGDREKAIGKAVRLIGEKINLRKELRTVLAQKKLEAAILCSIPPAVLLFFQTTSGEYAEILYTTLAGRIVMSGCLIAAFWAVNLCLRIMDVRI